MTAVTPNSFLTARLSSARRQQRRVRETVIDESGFLHLIRVERKRCERSGRPFLLALIMSDDMRSELHEEISQNIAAAIRATVRETDFLGWYEDRRTLGILFTEIGQADGSVFRVITDKILLALHRSLDEEQFRRVRLTCRIFPHQAANELDNPENEMFYPDRSEQREEQFGVRLLKRAIDVSGSVLALVILSPVLACLALAIKADSKGPVFYRQKRVGMFGKTFFLWKLRSMYVENDPRIHQEYVARLIAGAEGLQQSPGQATAYKLTNDPRVTVLGRFIRRTSLDELPQFVNILRGDMSLVGPRPPLPYEYERYRTWHKGRAVEVKPGLTGLWQVKGRSKTTFDEMVRMDLNYIKIWSIWLDLKILLQTPGAVLSGDGAY
jgi:lipopolysaccharide/colanic/teichoic acid biosynthesis glycosyltransferase